MSASPVPPQTQAQADQPPKKKQLTKHESSGFFQHGSTLDQIDKALSRPFFYCYLGVFEYVLSVPGVWFGVPAPSLVWMPTVISMVADPEMAVPYVPHVLGISSFLFLIVIPMFLGLLAVYFNLLLYGDYKDFYAVKHPLMAPGVVFSLFSTYFSSKLGVAVPSFYLCCYAFTMTVVLSLKVMGQRMRPGLCMEKELEKVPRVLTQLNYCGVRGHNAFESFPSGDAAGSMAFSFCLYVITGNYLSFIWAAISLFARLYLFAHHLLDVLVGGAIALCMCSFLYYVVGQGDVENFGWIHVLVVLPSFIKVVKFISSKKMPIPEEYEQKHKGQIW